ncbi:protein takeout-like [Chironomus tepperi]|uniref:protein takeout-like n=1 Tax=Chironomus tepperi TaxID=113505 RepID=UPI00391EEEA5
MRIFIEIFVILFVIQIKGSDSLLPPNIQTCHRNDPHISDCIVRSVTALLPRLATGDLGGGFKVPSLEPFVLKEISFGEENGLKVQLFNINVHGTTKFHVEKLRINVKDLKFDVLIALPKLDVKGKYKMVFNFLGAPVLSDGDLYTQFSGAKIRASMKGHRYLKNGKEYVKFEPFGIKFDRGVVSDLKITNLFNGNKVLGEIVHALLRNNPDFVIKNIYPSLESNLSQIFTNVGNTVVEQASIDELLPL